MPAYLDHAASTPMRPEAVEAMVGHLRRGHGNPSGAHTVARAARQVIDEARDELAGLLGAEPREVVFTSGGTEADNLAVLGVHDRVGGPVVVSAVEHHAVLEPALARGGRTVGVDHRGALDLDALAATLDELAAAGTPPRLVSIMLANNEVGTVQPLVRAARLVRRKAPEALVHTDAVQAFPWLDVAALAAGADLISISAHKFGGPQGVGALVVRESAHDRLAARQLGGGQERERRSGTPAVAAIAAMAVAARCTVAERPETVARVTAMRDRLARGLVDRVDGLIETAADAGGCGSGASSAPGRVAGGVGGAAKGGAGTTGAADGPVPASGRSRPPGQPDLVERRDADGVTHRLAAMAGTEDRTACRHRVAGACHVTIDGIETEALLLLLERAGVYASAGASCAAGAAEPSHVLAAMGVPRARALGGLRLSLGWSSTDEDVDIALEAIPAAVERLRVPA